MVNRAALLLRFKDPAIRWVNETAGDASPQISADEIDRDRTVYLVPAEVGYPPAALDRWLKQNYEMLFESELESWTMDISLWPEKPTWKLFREWFDVECHTMLFDTVGGAIHDDDA